MYGNINIWYFHCVFCGVTHHNYNDKNGVCLHSVLLSYYDLD